METYMLIYKFHDPTTKSIFKSGNALFFEDVEFVGGDTIRHFVFEERYSDIPIGVIGIDYGIPDFI